ncbi:hypothetical protein [Mycolicibacterium sp. J2]|uniref:hypothetical protein n=1 Tax=Mycolicibacterium sp. J2 TaxID=2993511 RepID=UPI00224A64A3|nr:hypothetical protein [Mycolicibacterium sp. J2]MCX2712042.1 hypothetical protein [Mycolicibacterium sp. J2]
MHSESKLRKIASRQGLRLVKYRESSRWFSQYGPYALADEGNCLVASGLQIDQLAAELQHP